MREQYVRFYGTEAADTDRTETLGLAGLRLDGQFAARRLWYLRGGVEFPGRRASPNATTPSARLPAASRWAIPPWPPKRNSKAKPGVTLAGEKLTVALSGFYARVDDYILPTVIARQGRQRRRQRRHGSRASTTSTPPSAAANWVWNTGRSNPSTCR